jgi:hypothetical protein
LFPCFNMPFKWMILWWHLGESFVWHYHPWYPNICFAIMGWWLCFFVAMNVLDNMSTMQYVIICLTKRSNYFFKLGYKVYETFILRSCLMMNSLCKTSSMVWFLNAYKKKQQCPKRFYTLNKLQLFKHKLDVVAWSIIINALTKARH